MVFNFDYLAYQLGNKRLLMPFGVYNTQEAAWGATRYGYGGRDTDYPGGLPTSSPGGGPGYVAQDAGTQIKNGIQGAIAGIVGEIDAIDFNDVFDQLETYLEEVHTDYFQFEADPNGAPWAPLASSTVRKKGHDTILFEEGKLQESLTSPNSEFAIRGQRGRTGASKWMRWGTWRSSDKGFPIAVYHQGEFILQYLGPARKKRKKRKKKPIPNWGTVSLRKQKRAARTPMSALERSLLKAARKRASIQRFGKAWAAKLERAYRIGRKPRPMVGLTNEAIDKIVEAIADHITNVLRKQS